MTVLQALDGYYDRMAGRGEAELPGFSREKISFAIVLSAEGEPIDVIDFRVQSGKRLQPALREVPAAVKRTAGISPNFLWDKTAYTLGRTGGEGKRTAEEHAAFKDAHLDLLADTEDEGLVALRRFLEGWTPERFDQPPFKTEMLDANIVFALDGTRGTIDERDAAKRLILARVVGEGPQGFCLVSGVHASTRRLHPTIKGVDGAQTAGAALVSFNLDAFTSYGKEQGANAPTSESAAFRYGAALNRLLDRGVSRNRLRIGDATVAFWADASGVGEQAAAAADDMFAKMVEPPSNAAEAAKVRDELEKVAAGRPVGELDAKLAPGTRFHVLGLAPNAARLSVRYWLSDDFEAFAGRLARHYHDLAIEPAPWGGKLPSVSRLLVKTTALQEKFDNIPPLLAGEVARAVLTGSAYPRTLLAAAITRLRAGDDPGFGWHAAVIKACINRSFRTTKEPLPVARDPDHPSKAYQLGRLFYALEDAQRAALGRVNASITDRYYGAASATPARVFGPLLRGLRNHVSNARKRKTGGWIEPRVAEIMSHLPPDLPKTLSLEDQGRFAVGYYHERGTRPTKDIPADDAADDKGDQK